MDESSQPNLHEDPRGRPDGEAGRFERADELAHVLAHGGCGVRKMIAYQPGRDGCRRLLTRVGRDAAGSRVSLSVDARVKLSSRRS